MISEYQVEDKKQVAEFDPNAWIEDEEEEEDARPCPVCGESDQQDVLLLCDACDAPYHTHCIGLSRIPDGNWFCMECADEGAYARAAEYSQSLSQRGPISGRFAPRTQESVRRNRQRMRSDHWIGAWSVISSRIHDVAELDLDFSDDDQPMIQYRQIQRRAAEERRRFNQWQRRLNIAGRQGAGNIFRESAPVRLRDATPPVPTETVEETRAWGAFEKAKELDTSSPASRNKKRKSRSVTGSPVEKSEKPQEPERKLKRPRTRRVLDKPESSATAPSNAGSSRMSNSHDISGSPTVRILNDANGEPSFLSSLLKEVEMASASDDDRSAFSATTISGPNRVTSPSLEYSSPAASPASSVSYHTPRAMSITPPPHISKRPGSPLPLTSRIEPIFPPAEYSPNRSPPENKSEQDRSSATELRQPRPRRRSRLLALPRSQDASPTRANLSIEAKEGITKLVKNALAPHWKAAEITKEQYADINRDVSRKLYEIVAERSNNNEREKSAWEKIATAEVATAVKSLTA